MQAILHRNDISALVSTSILSARTRVGNTVCSTSRPMKVFPRFLPYKHIHFLELMSDSYAGNECDT